MPGPFFQASMMMLDLNLFVAVLWTDCAKSMLQVRMFMLLSRVQHDRSYDASKSESGFKSSHRNGNLNGYCNRKKFCAKSLKPFATMKLAYHRQLGAALHIRKCCSAAVSVHSPWNSRSCQWSVMSRSRGLINVIIIIIFIVKNLYHHLLDDDRSRRW